jgi:Xaa-Pro aminopeptidase
MALQTAAVRLAAEMRTVDLDFDRNEYDQRVAAVRRQMIQRDIDVLIVDQFEHLVYLFGYLPTAAKYQTCLLPAEGDPHMVVRAMDLPVFTHQSWVTSHAVFADTEDPVTVAVRELKTRWGGALRLGLEFDSHLLTVQRYKQFGVELPNSKLVDFSGILTEQRLYKSPAEIEYLRQAAGVADQCMTAAICAAAVGVSEREPAAAAYSTAMRNGADNGRVLLSASGALSDSIHGRLGTRLLQNGDVLHLEMVPQVRGYSARLMRPAALGAYADSVRDAVELLVAIQDEQIGAMHPGELGSIVDAVARDQVLSSGLREQYHDHTGYTLGHHAQPRTSDHTRIFTPTADWKLQPGMVFHMFLSAHGVAIGETVLVTENGPQSLTKTSRQLFTR